MKKPKKQNWIVKITATVEKTVYCNDCTEEEARTRPFDYSIEEREDSQSDYEVKNVEVNE